MSRYTQLTQEQRYQTYALKKVGHTQAEIVPGQWVCINRRLAENYAVTVVERGTGPKASPKAGL
uniref:Uncharacterized protein n=1 Tax=Candidatus Kentrum sp. TC TaxID=2126339 RepID=A0A450YZ84_9GAMM|nr:MAG: hypothetical protein BECKTC1821E_GA0114239_10718 [Candidatus Kentron sp. TC]VFK51391.1 MAG: hypothetical protein BECKTC1821D_GA0114238_11343 [Candidatus Kentron sp. TC]